ncbi:MAG: hypothetical protein Q3974_09540 [Rothia sp. (in: high G+C Gram-positive bacteria)]|nr:hypothetical protein [Rothia sp. (in: high G+C Gram-positive bacteria)]
MNKSSLHTFARYGSATLALGALALTGLAPASASTVDAAADPAVAVSPGKITLPWTPEDYAWLGAPTDDGFIAPATPDTPGFMGQNFTQGAVFYNEVTGTHAVHGAIYDLWRYGTVTVGEGSALYNLIPVSDEQPVGQGVRQSFAQPGLASGNVFWSEATGAHFLESGTPAGDYFNAHGAVDAFGFPVSEVQQLGEASVLYTEKGVLTVGPSGAVFSPLG